MSSVFKVKRKQNAGKSSQPAASLSAANFASASSDNNNNVDLMSDSSSVSGDNNSNSLLSFASASTNDVDSIQFDKLSIEDKQVFAKATLFKQKEAQMKETTKQFNAKKKQVLTDLTQRMIAMQTRLGKNNLQFKVPETKQVWKLESKPGSINAVNEKYVLAFLTDFFINKRLALTTAADCEKFTKILFSEQSRGRKPDGALEPKLLDDSDIVQDLLVDLE